MRDKDMRTVKFLWDRHLDFMAWIKSAAFPAWWKVLFGFIEILLVCAVFIISWIFSTWYFALAITVGFILGICIVCCIIELLVRLIIKIVQK